MSEKKKKVKYIDDGRSVTDMNVDGMRGYDQFKKESADSRESLSPAEKRAFRRAAWLQFLKIAGFIAAGFVFAALVIYVWLG